MNGGGDTPSPTAPLFGYVVRNTNKFLCLTDGRIVYVNYGGGSKMVKCAVGSDQWSFNTSITPTSEMVEVNIEHVSSNDSLIVSYDNYESLEFYLDPDTFEGYYTRPYDPAEIG